LRWSKISSALFVVKLFVPPRMITKSYVYAAAAAAAAAAETVAKSITRNGGNHKR